MSTRENTGEPFGAPTNLGPNVNSPEWDASPALSADGLALIFSSQAPGGHGVTDLWMSTRSTANEPFGPAVNLGTTVNTGSAEGGPHLSADGHTLYFDSSRPKGRGRFDIYRAPLLPPAAANRLE
jgi:Tol biopolymer transport system component